MIEIYIDIDAQELNVNFERIQTNSGIKWVADCYHPEEVIEIWEVEGMPDENRIYISDGVSTPKIIVFERFMAAFNEYHAQLNAGFEPTELQSEDSLPLQPYNPDDIKVRRETFSVFEINRMMSDQDDIDLNPEFQRNLVWDNTRKSALIESILLGIPIPVFYFAESKTGMYHVVDGLQRLSTIKQFLNNEFYLKKLEHLQDDCNGKYYKADPNKKIPTDKALDRKHSRRLENAQLIVNVIESASPQKVKYDIFKRLNTGGRPLNNQEIRNCIATNPVRKVLKVCAKSDEFKSATGGSISDNRMDAQEMVLRFIGFRLEREGRIAYSSDMNSFLDETLDIINDFAEADLIRYKELFLKSMRINHHMFGDYCFRKCLSEHLSPKARKQNINKALFVSWSMEVLALNEQKVKEKVLQGSFAGVLARKLDAKDRYYTILTTGTSDKQNLKEASEYAKGLLVENNLL